MLPLNQIVATDEGMLFPLPSETVPVASISDVIPYHFPLNSNTLSRYHFELNCLITATTSNNC